LVGWSIRKEAILSLESIERLSIQEVISDISDLLALVVASSRHLKRLLHWDFW